MSDEKPDTKPNDEDQTQERSTEPELATTALAGGELQVRSIERREIEAMIVPWNVVVNSPIGPEVFLPGSFSHVNPKKVIIRLEHDGAPAGRGMSLEERSEGPVMAFHVSKTQAGDDLLTLAQDGVTPHVSVAYYLPNTESDFQLRSGRRVTAHRKVDLREVVTTWKPYYEQAAVLSVRSKQDETGEAPMSDVAAPDNGATPELPAIPQADESQIGAVQAALSGMSKIAGTLTGLTDRLDTMEERSRSNFSIPNGEPERPAATRGEWMDAVLHMLSGGRISERDLQTRALADLITTDNLGVVPDAFSTEIIGVIDPRRPFMNTTRRLETPSSGMSLVMPRIVTRPTVGIQETEKTELTSTATAIDSVSFDAVSKGGAGDISLQLLKRSSPSYLTLYMDLLFEAYAIDSEQEAVESLIASGVQSGGALDPEDLALGGAWSDAFDSVRNGPNTIWMSSAAVGAFIDAKASGTNAPLYSNLGANFTAGNGAGGSISGLNPVHVPALNATDIDVIVGPSNGFAWAEDGTFTLQVDVPAKAGRDVAVIGILWFAPLYPAAFTAYSVAGGGS